MPISGEGDVVRYANPFGQINGGAVQMLVWRTNGSTLGVDGFYSQQGVIVTTEINVQIKVQYPMRYLGLSMQMTSTALALNGNVQMILRRNGADVPAFTVTLLNGATGGPNFFSTAIGAVNFAIGDTWCLRCPSTTNSNVWTMQITEYFVLIAAA